jgi:hypothetical protein
MTEPTEAGIRDLIHQFREFLVALRLSPGRHRLALLVAATLFAVGATAVAQLSLNAWNGPFYEAIAQRNFSAFLYELLVFSAIAGGLRHLNRSDHLLETHGQERADGFVLPADFACRRRHGAAARQIVAVIERQVEIELVGQCERSVRLGRGHVGLAGGHPMSQSLPNQSLLRRELGIERSMGQARGLADLRDADAVDPSLPEQARGCLDQRRAILGRFFLGDLHRLSRVAAGLTLKIASAI